MNLIRYVLIGFAAVAAGCQLFGMDKNIDQKLIEAAGTGNLPTMRKLIHQGANVNAYYSVDDDLKMKTALDTAIDKDHPKAVRLLLANGADANLRSRWFGEDISPLMHAAGKADYEMVKLLLAHNADIHANNNGRGVLFNAIGTRCRVFDLHSRCIIKPAKYPVVRLLLEHGADAGMVRTYATQDGLDPSTPLMQAASLGDSELCDILLTTIINADAPMIRNEFTGLMATHRMKFAEGRGSLWIVEHSEQPVLHSEINELKKVRSMISQKIVDEYLNKYLTRAIFLMRQQNLGGKTASDLALHYTKDPMIAALLDPKNPQAIERLKKIIEKNVRTILVSQEKIEEKAPEESVAELEEIQAPKKGILKTSGASGKTEKKSVRFNPEPEIRTYKKE